MNKRSSNYRQQNSLDYDHNFENGDLIMSADIKKYTKKVLLGLKNIYKNFNTGTGEIKVLENISLNINNKEIVAMVGPSGCGKTTMLNIAAGLLSADKGEVHLSRDKVLAYIFQEPRLLPWKTVEENINFVQENFLTPAAAKEICDRLLSKTDLLDFKDSYPAQLSGGMKQRLEIVRALSISPDIVLMDEPFKSLDICLKYQLQEILLEEFKGKGFGVFFITHDPEDAVLLADRIIILSDKPTGINRVLEINIPRQERSLKNEDIYNILQETLEMIL